MPRETNANNGLRPALIEAAAQLIATEGAGALTLRRVAEEVGTSTMAIYTHFGGMPALRRAVRAEGFARLAEHVPLSHHTSDPVADLVLMGVGYNENAMSNPHLYRAMFMEPPLDEADADAYAAAFEPLADAIRRCIDAGRFAPSDAVQLANQFWSIGHGAYSWQLAGVFSPEEALRCASTGLLSLFVGWGDDRDAARRSLIEAGRRGGVDSGQARARVDA